MPCIEITDDDFDDMHHALGRPADPMRDCYRNFFTTEVGGATARRFEATGCWEFMHTINDGRDAVYRVSADGRSALADWIKLGGGRS